MSEYPHDPRHIHATALVAEGARIGANTDIGPYACIGPHVILAENCRVGPHVALFGHTTIGPGTRIHAGAVIGDEPQDRAFTNERSYVEIGAGCVLREGVTVHRGTHADTKTVIGSGCFLMAFCHVAHNVQLGQNVTIANGALLGGHVSIGAGAFISGGCVVHQFVRVGRLAMVGGNAGLSQDLPPFCTLRSVALNHLGGLNTVGLRRNGIDGDARRALQRAYRTIFRSSRGPADACRDLLDTTPSEPVRELCEFILTAKRGVCRHRARSARLEQQKGEG